MKNKELKLLAFQQYICETEISSNSSYMSKVLVDDTATYTTNGYSLLYVPNDPNWIGKNAPGRIEPYNAYDPNTRKVHKYGFDHRMIEDVKQWLDRDRVYAQDFTIPNMRKVKNTVTSEHALLLEKPGHYEELLLHTQKPVSWGSLEDNWFFGLKRVFIQPLGGMSLEILFGNSWKDPVVIRPFGGEWLLFIQPCNPDWVVKKCFKNKGKSKGVPAA